MNQTKKQFRWAYKQFVFVGDKECHECEEGPFHAAVSRVKDEDGNEAWGFAVTVDAGLTQILTSDLQITTENCWTTPKQAMRRCVEDVLEPLARRLCQ